MLSEFAHNCEYTEYVHYPKHLYLHSDNICRNRDDMCQPDQNLLNEICIRTS